MTGKSKEDMTVISLDQAQFRSLTEAVKDLIKVIAATQIQRDAGTERNARFLKVFGLTEYEIGDLLGVDQSTVNKALSKSKKKSGKPSKGSDDTIAKT